MIKLNTIFSFIWECSVSKNQGINSHTTRKLLLRLSIILNSREVGVSNGLLRVIKQVTTYK